MSDDLLGKKVHAKGKTGEIVRVYTVIGLKESERVNVRWNDGTVSVEMRLSDSQIVDYPGDDGTLIYINFGRRGIGRT